MIGTTLVIITVCYLLIHCGVEDTELSTNKQHTLSLSLESHHPLLLRLPYLKRAARIVGIAALNEPRHAMLLSAQNPWVVRTCVRVLVTCHVLAQCNYSRMCTSYCMHAFSHSDRGVRV
jgi:hypothetical protein